MGCTRVRVYPFVCCVFCRQRKSQEYTLRLYETYPWRLIRIAMGGMQRGVMLGIVHRSLVSIPKLSLDDQCWDINNPSFAKCYISCRSFTPTTSYPGKEASRRACLLHKNMGGKRNASHMPYSIDRHLERAPERADCLRFNRLPSQAAFRRVPVRRRGHSYLTHGSLPHVRKSHVLLCYDRIAMHSSLPGAASLRYETPIARLRITAESWNAENTCRSVH